MLCTESLFWVLWRKENTKRKRQNNDKKQQLYAVCQHVHFFLVHVKSDLPGLLIKKTPQMDKALNFLRRIPSSNTCKNDLLKIYSQEGNFLNAI